MKHLSPVVLLVILLVDPGCRPDQPNEVYYPFRDQVWHRFNILSFEIPVESSAAPYKVVFYARHNEKFPYRNLDFHMILRTPGGEERIREFSMKVRNNVEKPLGTCDGEVCDVSLILKKDLYIDKDGLVVIELENLIPRIETPGLLGVGIRLERD